MLRTDEDIPYIEKPWGYERIWAETDHYLAKYIYIRAGQKLSRKYYESKDHTLYVLTGPLILELGPDDDMEDVLKLGVATAGPGAPIRLEDDYGRIPEICA